MINLKLWTSGKKKKIIEHSLQEKKIILMPLNKVIIFSKERERKKSWIRSLVLQILIYVLNFWSNLSGSISNRGNTKTLQNK